MRSAIVYDPDYPAAHLASWVVKRYLEQLGIQPLFIEDLSMVRYLYSAYDLMDIHLISSKLAPDLIKQVIIKQFRLTLISTNISLKEELNDVIPGATLYPTPASISHRVNIILNNEQPLPELAWRYYNQEKEPPLMISNWTYSKKDYHLYDWLANDKNFLDWSKTIDTEPIPLPPPFDEQRA